MDDSQDWKVRDANARLDQGLRACRSVLNDYRAVLTADGAEKPGESSEPLSPPAKAE
ncbi:MAG: hypothetical protein ABIO80_07700 [Sphingomicrobium sp.]